MPKEGKKQAAGSKTKEVSPEIARNLELTKQLNSKFTGRRYGKEEEAEFVLDLVKVLTLESSLGEALAPEVRTRITETIVDYFVPVNSVGKFDEQKHALRFQEALKFLSGKAANVAGAAPEISGLQDEPAKMQLLDSSEDAVYAGVGAKLFELLSGSETLKQGLSESLNKTNPDMVNDWETKTYSSVLDRYFADSAKAALYTAISNLSLNEREKTKRCGQLLGFTSSASVNPYLQHSNGNFRRYLENTKLPEPGFLWTDGALINAGIQNLRSRDPSLEGPLNRISAPPLEEHLNRISDPEHKDSKYMKPVKSGMEELKAVMKDPSKAKEAQELFTKLYASCEDYLDNRKGYRWTTAGKERKKAIAGLRDYLKTDKAFQDLYAGMLDQLAKREELTDPEEKKAADKLAATVKFDQISGDLARIAEERARAEEERAGAEKKLRLQAEEERARVEKELRLQAENEKKRNEEANRKAVDQLAELQSKQTDGKGVFSLSGQGKDDTGKTQDLLRYAQVFSEFNVRDDLLKSLGHDPKTMSADEIHAVLHEEGNQDRINDRLSELSEWAERISNVMNSPEMVQARENFMAAATDDRVKEMFAKADRSLHAMAKGLEAERKWKQLRTSHEENQPVDRAEAAAFRWSLEVQRRAIEKDGTLSSQGIYQTDMIQSIPGHMSAILSQEPRASAYIDNRRFLYGKSVSDIMKDSDPTFDRVMKEMVATAAHSCALNKFVAGEKNEKGQRMLQDANFTGKAAEKLLTSPLIQTSRNNQKFAMMVGYNLSQGHTLDEILAEPRSIKQAFDRFNDYLDNHVAYKKELQPDGKGGNTRIIPEEELQEWQHEYRKGYLEGCKAIKIPVVHDPIDRALNGLNFMAIEALAITLDSPPLNEIKNDPEESRNLFEQVDTGLNLIAAYSSMDEITGTPTYRMGGHFMNAMNWNTQFGGMTIGALGNAVEGMQATSVMGSGAVMEAVNAENAWAIISGQKVMDSDDKAMVAETWNDTGLGEFVDLDLRNPASKKAQEDQKAVQSDSKQEKARANEAPEKRSISLDDLVAKEQTEPKQTARKRSNSVHAGGKAGKAAESQDAVQASSARGKTL